MDQDPDAPDDDATRPRLRTFRTSSDHPFLVLPGDRQENEDAAEESSEASTDDEPA